MVRCLLLTLLIGAGCPLTGVSEPDPAAAMRAIDTLVAEWRASGRPLALGLVVDVTATAIDTGAPVYNAGEIEDCADIYRHAIGTLLDLDPGVPEDASEDDPLPAATRRAVEELRAAATRADASDDHDARAWTLRFAFDSANLEYRLVVARGQLRLQQGREYFLRANFVEAEIAFADAAACAEEALGSDPAALDRTLRLAPLALGHVQILHQDFRAAARSLTRGVTWSPELATETFVLGQQFPGDGSAFQAAEEALDEAVAEQLDDVDLLFLQGYCRYFGGEAEAAEGVFRLVHQLDPDHPAAGIFLDAAASGESAMP